MQMILDHDSEEARTIVSRHARGTVLERMPPVRESGPTS